jgi:hypothetical protein
MLFSICLFGLVLRLLEVNCAGNIYIPSDYIGSAVKFLKSGEFYFDVHPPGYSFLITIMLLMSKNNPFALIYASALCGSLSILIIFIVSRYVLRSEYASLACSLIVALSPVLINSSVVVWRDIYVFTFVLISCVAFFFAHKERRVINYLFFGSSLMFAFLIDLRSMLLIFPIVVYLLFFRESDIKKIFVTTFVVFVLISPVALRVFEMTRDGPQRDIILFAYRIHSKVVPWGLYSLSYVQSNLDYLFSTVLRSSWLISILAIVGILYLVRFNRLSWAFLFTGLFVSGFAIVAFWGYFLWHATDLSIFLVFYFLLAASGFEAIDSLFGKLINKKILSRLYFVVLLIVLWVGFSQFAGHLYNCGSGRVSELDVIDLRNYMEKDSFLLAFMERTPSTISFFDGLSLFLRNQEIVRLSDNRTNNSILVNDLLKTGHKVYFIRYNNLLLGTDQWPEQNEYFYNYLREDYVLTRLAEKNNNSLYQVTAKTSTR